MIFLVCSGKQYDPSTTHIQLYKYASRIGCTGWIKYDRAEVGQGDPMQGGWVVVVVVIVRMTSHRLSIPNATEFVICGTSYYFKRF